MKKIKIIIIIGLLLSNVLVLKINAQNKIISEIFKDENLAQNIAETLEKSVDDTVTQDELNTIEMLFADSLNITNLEGIQHLNNLKELYLNDNKIKNINQISNLINLEQLFIDNNEIEDLSPLTNLINLNYLSLQNNKIKNIEPLGTLINLQSLILNDNQIKSIEILKKLDKLISVQLSDQQNYETVNIKTTEYEIQLPKNKNNETISPTHISHSGVLENDKIKWRNITDEDEVYYEFSEFTSNSEIFYVFFGRNTIKINILQKITAIFEDCEEQNIEGYESDEIELPTPNQEGYTFEAWMVNNKEVKSPFVLNENTTFVAKWNINQYEITFDTDGGNEISPIKNDYNSEISLPIPTKENSKFIGWKENNNTVNSVYTLKKDVTLVAIWAESIRAEYTVSFDSNGGNSIQSISKEEGQKIELPIPKKENYTFLGWYDFETLVNSPYTISEDLTLKAKWVENEKILGKNEITLTIEEVQKILKSNNLKNELILKAEIKAEFNNENVEITNFTTNLEAKKGQYEAIFKTEKETEFKTKIIVNEENHVNNILAKAGFNNNILNNMLLLSILSATLIILKKQNILRSQKKQE